MKTHFQAKLKLFFIALFCVMFCVLFFSFSQGVASAESECVYKIYFENSKYFVSNPQGEILYENSEFNEIAIDDAIKNDANGCDYTFDIGQPNLDILCQDGFDKMPFNQTKNLIKLEASFEHFVDIYVSPIDYKWLYKKSGTDKYVSSDSFTYSTFVFGQNLDIGFYDIKLVINYNFLLNGQNYEFNASCIKNSFIEITSNDDFPIGDIPSIELTYGTKNSEIDIFDSRGNWVLSQSENQDELLAVGNHNLLFDFVPHNPNYLNKTKIGIDIKVVGFPVKVLVHNKSSVKGNDLEKLTYDLLTENLLGGDSVEDLKITLLKEDGDEAGIYTIFGYSENPKYEVTFLNEENPDGYFSVGGTYKIIPNKIELNWDNGAKIKLESQQGFVDGTELVFIPIKKNMPDDLLVKGEYITGEFKLMLENNGVQSVLPNDCKIEIDNIYNLAKTVVVFDGKWTRYKINNGNVKFLANDKAQICFIGEKEVEQLQDWSIATIVLGCIAGILMLAVLIVSLKRFGGRK